MKYLNVVKVHTESVHSHAEAQAGKCFQIWDLKLVLNSKEWRFLKPLLHVSLHYLNMQILLSDL